MGGFLALTRKEIAAILLSVPLLLATAFFVLLDSFAFYLGVVRGGAAYAVFDDMARFMLVTSILMFPIISMRSFSAEKAQGTLETLLTAPIGVVTAVLAKFAGAMLYAAIYLLHGLAYAALLAYGGNLDWHAAIAAFLALLMVGALAMSLGIFVSSLTLSPTAAAAGTTGVLILMVAAAYLDPHAGAAASLFHATSFVPHANRWISGEIDTGGMVYFLSLVCLFLFYAWLSVSAHSIEKRAATPASRRRMRVTYLLLLLGFVCLLAQAAALHIKGIWEADAPLGSNLLRVPWPWLTPLGTAVFLIGWSILTYRASRRAERVNPARREARYATISETRVLGASRHYYEESAARRRRRAAAAAAALVVVLNVNWLARYPFRTFADSGRLSFLTVLRDRRWDVSQDGRNSLSPATRRALDGLQGKVEVYDFLRHGTESRGVPVEGEIRRLLERYRDYNSLVSVAKADPDREPGIVGALAKELDARPEDLRDTVVVSYRGRRQTLPAASLAAPPEWRARAAGDARWVFDGENRLTRAIMRVSDPRVPRMLFTVGHGELSVTEASGPDRSAVRFARALADANIRVGVHRIAADRPIPLECDILAIAMPGIPFREDEVDAVRRFLDAGGRLLLLAPAAKGPYGASGDPEGDPLNELAFAMGGGFRNDILLDPVNNHGGDSARPGGKGHGAGDDSRQFVFPASRSIRDNPRSPANGWVTERQADSFPSSFSSPLDGGSARQGPFTVVYRSSRLAGGGRARAVVAASGAMASDAHFGEGENAALLLALTQWLAGREDPRDIAPRTWVDRRVKLVGPQMRAVLWIGVVALPLAWFLAGISIWWLRKE